jgi:hypothetical protein
VLASSRSSEIADMALILLARVAGAAFAAAVALAAPALPRTAAAASGAGGVGEARVLALAERSDVDGLRALGPRVLPVLARLYPKADAGGRARIADAFYALGWKSEEARRAMMADVHTADQRLRLAVQWALGRVSNDDAVVDALLANMKADDNPLFREKAACGLASDQIHLTEEQKLRLFTRLVDLLESPSEETRSLSIRILWTWTGQAKGFRAHFPPGPRREGVARWRRWLEEYQASL